jgi:NAD(P)-dependent dehydrogenase (short-subunit alcohol dehydrogenase family)
MPNFRCDDRLAVITGAAGTLGPMWATTLAAAGATTVAIAQPGTEQRPEVEHLAELGVEIMTADTTSADSLKAVTDDITRRWGPPDILVANAGLDSTPAEGRALDLGALRLDDVAPVLHTNAVGTALTISGFGGHMVAAGRGSIILIASQYALVSPRPAIYSDAGLQFTKNPAYGASKAAVVQLARYFAAHWSGSGVRVNALCPGGIENDQPPRFKRHFAKELPLGRMLRPDELQGALLFLASDASTAMTGSQLVIDGGYTSW